MTCKSLRAIGSLHGRGRGDARRRTSFATEIQVGATYVQGTNSLVMSLNEDDHHKPGKALHTWRFANLPTSGSCCTVQTGKFAKGIKVKKGAM